MTQDIIRMAAQQALNLIERLNLRGWILADFEEEVYASIAALKAALAQPPLPVQEPTPWRDMVVVSLVREGINKHRARELADHFVNFTLPPPLPVQEPLEQLRPAEFIQLTKGKEAVTGIPAYCWSEWLNKEQP